MTAQDWIGEILAPATTEQVAQQKADWKIYQRQLISNGVAEVLGTTRGPVEGRRAVAARKIADARRKFGSAAVREALKNSLCLPY
jgi:hypothetical protein